MGVLEAIAHGESAHRAYVIYATSRAEFDVAPEEERIMELGWHYTDGESRRSGGLGDRARRDPP